MLFCERFPWPESIPTLDRLATEKLLRCYDDAPFSAALFLAFLINASRSGHAFIEILEEQIMPPPLETKELILEGKDLVPEPLVVKEGDRYYLPHNYMLQKECLKEWNRLTAASPLYPYNQTPCVESLTHEQANAVQRGCLSQVFILTGGPGTGKTYTAGKLLQNLQHPSKQVAIAAPTGKAALMLEKSLGGSIKAKTLHALLGMKGDGSFPDRLSTLPFDLILVDEASMINMEMMNRLLTSVKSGAQLILMGDPYQLPPVEGIPIFPFLVQNHTAKVELTQCLRAETEELIIFARSILRSEPLQSNRAVLFTDEPLEVLLSSHLDYFPKTAKTPKELLAAFQKFRILTPLKGGRAGSQAVNQWIGAKLQEEGVKAIPIMITANDYRFELFNGEVGVLEGDYAYFSSGKRLPTLLLPPYEPAYALTVHKSQGSEFEHVLLLLPRAKGAESAPLLYTAVTRARKKITLWKENIDPT